MGVLLGKLVKGGKHWLSIIHSNKDFSKNLMLVSVVISEFLGTVQAKSGLDGGQLLLINSSTLAECSRKKDCRTVSMHR